MRLTVFLSTFFFFASLTFGQTHFSKVYYTSTDIFGYTFVQKSDNGYVVGGKSGIDSGHLTHLDEQGNFQRTVHFTPEAVAFDSYIMNSVIKDSDSTFVFSGQVFKWPESRFDLMLMRTNENGDTLNISAYYENGSPNSHSGKSMVYTNDDHIALIALSNYSVTSALSFLLLNQDGSIVWSKTYDAQTTISPKCLKQLQDSSYLIGGSIGQDGFWMNISSDGAVLWAYRSPEIIPDNFIVNGDQLFMSGTNYTNGSSERLQVARIDHSGTILASTSLYGSIYHSAVTDLIFLPDNTIAAISGSDISSYYVVLDTNLNWLDGVMLECSAKKLLLNQNQQPVILGNGPMLGLRSTDLTFQGQFCILQLDTLLSDTISLCAYHHSLLQEPFSTALTPLSLTVSTPDFVQYHPAVSLSEDTLVYYDGCVSHLSSIEEAGLLHVTIYPTISEGIVVLNSEEAQNGKLTITDATGKSLSDYTFFHGETTYHLEHLPAGMYFFHLQTADGRHQMQRVILTGN